MKKKNVRILLCFLLIFAMAFAFTACGGGAETDGGDAGTADTTEKETITLTIGGGHTAESMAYTSVAVHQFMPTVAERVATETNYEIEWNEVWGGSVATVAEGLNACQDGLVDVLVNTYSFESARIFPMLISYYAPFSSDDPFVATNAMRSVYEQYQTEYDDLWAKYNQKFLAFGPTGGYELALGFRVDSTADFDGHKVQGAGASMDWLDGNGLTPVESNLNESYTNMQNNLYEGICIHADAAAGYKLFEVAPYFTKIGFGSLPIQGISVNLDIWDGLPEEVRSIFLEEAINYEEAVCQATVERTQEAEQEIIDGGGEIIEVSDEERAAYAANLKNLSEIGAQELDNVGFPGKDVMNAYIKAQEDGGNVYIRDWTLE